MRVSRLTLEKFRSYKREVLDFGDLNLVLGPNASGKTNILEALWLLGTGKSFRAERIEQMIFWEEELGRVEAVVERGKGKDVEAYELGVTLTRGEYMGKKTRKRRYFVNGNPRRRDKFLGNLSLVLFRPEDLRLIEGSPSRRRGFLNDALSSSSSVYREALKAYRRALRRRNKLLDLIREGEAGREQLAFWDATLIKNGNIVTDARRTFLKYLSQVEVEFGEYELEYDYSAISEKRLVQYEREEVSAGYTLVGPHKDDFTVVNNEEREKDLHIYGSRGEQRLGVLFLKLGVLQFVEERLDEPPVLLLDDIFSELDEVHRGEVLKMCEGRQAIITTADHYLIDEFKGRELEVLRTEI